MDEYLNDAKDTVEKCLKTGLLSHGELTKIKQMIDSENGLEHSGIEIMLKQTLDFRKTS